MNNKEIKSNKRKLEIHILDRHVLTWLLSETLTWLLKERKKERKRRDFERKFKLTKIFELALIISESFNSIIILSKQLHSLTFDMRMKWCSSAWNGITDF